MVAHNTFGTVVTVTDSHYLKFLKSLQLRAVAILVTGQQVCDMLYQATGSAPSCVCHQARHFVWQGLQIICITLIITCSFDTRVHPAGTATRSDILH